MKLSPLAGSALLVGHGILEMHEGIQFCSGMHRCFYKEGQLKIEYHFPWWKTDGFLWLLFAGKKNGIFGSPVGLAPVALGVGSARIRIRSTSHDCHTDYARRMPLCPWCMCGNSGIEWIFYAIFSQSNDEDWIMCVQYLLCILRGHGLLNALLEKIFWLERPIIGLDGWFELLNLFSRGLRGL